MSASNKIALVTGANKGIGFEIVRQLAEQQPSTTILLGSRSQANGDAALHKLPEAARNNVKVLLIDLTDDASVKAAAAKVKAEYGRLDILFNNAGVAALDFDHDTVKRILDTNVYGVKRVTDAFLPLIPAQTGHISIVSSEVGTWSHYYAPAGLQQQLEDPNVQWATIDTIAQAYLACAADPKHAGVENFPDLVKSHGCYGFSKALVSTYGRMLGRDLKAKGIPVILSSPGYCATDLNRRSGFRTAAQGGASCLQVLQRGVADSGKLFLDNEDQGMKNDVPEMFKHAPTPRKADNI